MYNVKVFLSFFLFFFIFPESSSTAVSAQATAGINALWIRPYSNTLLLELKGLCFTRGYIAPLGHR